MIPDSSVVVMSRSDDRDSMTSGVMLGADRGSTASVIMLGTDRGLFKVGEATAGMGLVFMRLALGYCKSEGVLGLGDMLRPGDALGSGGALESSDVAGLRDI